MHPDRVARLLAILGIYLLLAVLGLRVVSLVTITWQDRMGISAAPGQPVVPSLGHYFVSADGRLVTFERQITANGDTGWFSVPFEGGRAGPSQKPEDSLAPFQVRSNMLFLQVGDDYNPIEASPRDTVLAGYTRAPDGGALAFAAFRPGGTWGLYVVSTTGKLDWLGDHDRIGEIAWSAGSQNLAYIAETGGATQVFVTSRDGQDHRQLTGDSTTKSRPRWSPDGRMVAYIASTEPKEIEETPTPAGPPPHGPYQPTTPPIVIPESAIAVVGTDGSNPRIFQKDSLEKLDLSWGMEDSDQVVVFTQSLPGYRKTFHLFALDPQTGAIRRVYPPQEIKALECPAYFERDKAGVVRITIANSGLRAANVHLLLRARPQRFSSAGKVDTDVVRADFIPVPAGRQQIVEWPVAAQSGLFTHISVLINPDSNFPMDEKRCTVQNTYYSRLPDLPYLSVVLPLTLPGLLLFIPWLRRQKKPVLWGLYLALPLLIVILILVELWLVRRNLS